MGDIALRGNKLTRTRKMGGGRTNLLEELGRVEAEPSNRNRRAEISRVHGELNRGYNKGGRVGLKHGGKPWGSGPKPGTIEFLQHHTQTPKRKGKAVGGAVKIGKRFLDFIKTGKHVDKSGVKVNVPKAAERLTGKPHVDHGKRKKIKHLGRGKAEGGRIGRASGGPALKRVAEKTFERFGGGEKGKPHSSKEGRIAAGKQNIKRLMGRRKEWNTPGWKKKPDRKLQPYSRQPAKKGGKADKKWMQKVSASIKKRGTKGKCTPITKPGCTGRAKALAKTFKKIAAKRKKS